MENILFKTPITSHKKLQAGHFHIVTVSIGEQFNPFNSLNDINDLNLSLLKEEFLSNFSIQSILECAKNKKLNLSVDDEFDSLFSGKSLWKKTSKSETFHLDDFYGRVTELFNYTINGDQCHPLELSKEALKILQGDDFIAHFYAGSSINIKQSQDASLSKLQLKIDEGYLRVKLDKVLLTILPSNHIFVHFVIQYLLPDTGAIPNFSQLSYAVKNTSTALNRGHVLTNTPLTIDDSKNYEYEWNTLIMDQGLETKKKNRAFSKLVPKLGATLLKHKQQDSFSFNLTGLALKLLGIPSAQIISVFSSTRLHSYFLSNIDNDVSQYEIDYLGFLFSKQYTSSYSAPKHLVGVEKIAPLENKIHYCAQEGGALFILAPNKGFGSNQFDDLYIYNRGLKTYFPLSIVSLHEYLLLVKSLHIPFENFNSLVESDRHYKNALNVRLNYRTLVASQLSQHNEVHNCWRSSFKLDALHRVLAEDVRELHENTTKNIELKSALENELSSLETEKKELLTERKQYDNQLVYSKLGALLSAVLVTLGVLGINKEFLPLPSSPILFDVFFDFALIILCITVTFSIIPILGIRRERKINIKKSEEKMHQITTNIERKSIEYHRIQSDKIDPTIKSV